MATDYPVEVGVRIAWWLRPYLWAVGLLCRIGVPLSAACVQRIANRGVKVWHRGRWQ